MRKRAELKPYQVEAIERACRGHVALLMQPGDGKTVVAETALLDANALPALVVAPALVVEVDVWGDEARAWDHLSDLHVQPLVGPPARREVYLSMHADVEVVSYENLLWLMEKVPRFRDRYRAVVWDELSKMKHAGTRRFRRARHRVAHFDLRLGLTGSPVGNHLLDLWGEMFMVGAGAPLGPTFGGYRDAYFEPYDFQQRVWGLKGMRRDERGRPTGHTPTSRRLERAIFKRVAPWSYVRPTEERPGVPPVREVVHRLPLPAAVERMLTELRAQLWTTLPSGAELEALAAGARAMKARQLSGGAVYRLPDAARDERAERGWGAPWEPVHEIKLRALLDLVDELQGEPVLVYYQFKHEQERILAVLKGRAVASLGGKNDAETVRRFCDRQLDVLLAHPQTGGMGLNLQAGGHHVAWFALPWARWEYDQGCARLARLGQTAPEVTSHQFLCGPVDADVAEVLRRKGATERRLFTAVRKG